MNLDERSEQIIQEFSEKANWQDRYKKIIEIGKSLEPMPEEMKTDDNKVKGCQSQVWIFAKKDSENCLQLYADSDALIVRGLVALLLKFYNGAKLTDVIGKKPEFLKELGFESNLSPSRANGLNSMIKQIQFYAIALNSMP